jgi:endonuclease I
MKKITTLLFLLIVSVCFAQIPTGYYNTATGSGYTLKTQLFDIIDNNTNSSGTANYGDLWTLYTQSAFRDNYYENNGSLLDIYSEKPSGPDSYEYSSTSEQCSGSTPSAEGGCYNREHTMPQSVFSSNYPMYSDAHFVLPTDNRVNGWRDNYPFGKVVSTTAVAATNGTVANAASTPVFMTNQSRLGQNSNSDYASGYSDVVFEPIDEFKGDIARAMLYFATRYQNQITSWTYVMFNGTSNQVFTDTFLNILIKWHLQDAVSPYEIAKNNAVYNFQGNRNPYIDHPEYVCQIWASQCAALASEGFINLNDISVYPNPSNENRITIESALPITTIQLFSIGGQLIKEVKNPVFSNTFYTLENLPKGFYFLRLSSDNQATTKKVTIN